MPVPLVYPTHRWTPSEARCQCHEILVEWFLQCEGFALDTLPQRRPSFHHFLPQPLSHKEMYPNIHLLKVSPMTLFHQPGNTWQNHTMSPYRPLFIPDLALWPCSSFFWTWFHGITKKCWPRVDPNITIHWWIFGHCSQGQPEHPRCWDVGW